MSRILLLLSAQCTGPVLLPAPRGICPAGGATGSALPAPWDLSCCRRHGFCPAGGAGSALPGAPRDLSCRRRHGFCPAGATRVLSCRRRHGARSMPNVSRRCSPARPAVPRPAVSAEGSAPDLCRNSAGVVASPRLELTLNRCGSWTCRSFASWWTSDNEPAAEVVGRHEFGRYGGPRGAGFLLRSLETRLVK